MQARSEKALSSFFRVGSQKRQPTNLSNCVLKPLSRRSPLRFRSIVQDTGCRTRAVYSGSPCILLTQHIQASSESDPKWVLAIQCLPRFPLEGSGSTVLSSVLLNKVILAFWRLFTPLFRTYSDKEPRRTWISRSQLRLVQSETAVNVGFIENHNESYVL